MDKLRDLREDADLTQAKLAKFLGCSQATYSRYETDNLNVPIDILKKLANYYNVSLDYITGLTDTKNPYGKSNLNDENKK